MEEQTKSTGNAELDFLADIARTTDRRRFLRFAGLTLAVTAVGCAEGGLVQPTTVATTPLLPGAPNGDHQGTATSVNLGTGDTAVLNYAFALEQLEYAFYVEVLNAPYAGMTAQERAILEDLRVHEDIHQKFFREALGAAGIATMRFDFTSVNFADRTSVLTTARTLEDVGVSAYNGAAQLLTSLDFLTLAGKIVSVEARHAAAIRDLLAPGTAAFAGDDVVNAQGLDVVRVPSQVLPLADPLIVTTIVATGLPTPTVVPASPTA
jgi:rubrerythrin